MKNSNEKKYSSLVMTGCILVAMIFFAGCQLYQKATPLSPEAGNLSKSQYLNYLLSIQYYIILHHGKDCWHLKNLTPDSSVTAWNAEIETADPAYISFYNKANANHMPSYHKIEKTLLKQAHVFPANSSIIITSGKVNFNLSSARIETLKEKHYVGAFVALAVIMILSIYASSSFSMDFGSGGFTI